MMDKFIKFCLPLELQNWLNKYKAPGYEYAFAKDIPNTLYEDEELPLSVYEDDPINKIEKVI